MCFIWNFLFLSTFIFWGSVGPEQHKILLVWPNQIAILNDIMWGSVAALISVCDQLVLKALTILQVHIFISSFTFIQHILFIYFCCLVLCETCHCLGSFSIMSFHIFIVVFNVPFDFCVQFYNNS